MIHTLRAAVFAAALWTGVASAQELQLKDVLQSVAKNYPPLLAALQEREIADGDILNAQGRFDLNLRARFDSDSLGFYKSREFDFGFDQATAFQGLSFSAGWRRSDGTFPSYDGKLETNSGGQYRAGMRLPLLRDRSIDNRRADLGKAQIGRRLADLSVDQQRLTILQAATRRYWDWVAAGRRYAVVKSLLDIAIARDSQLKEAVRLGQLPPIEVTDNQRAILQRQSLLVEGDRALQQAAIELSLFYRDDTGQPALAANSQLPSSFPLPRELTQQQFLQDIDVALRRRPEIERVQQQREQTEIDARLARNQQTPNVDFLFGYTREAGAGAVKRGPDELRAALQFDLPFQRRSAAGRLKVAEARVNQFNQREQFAKDQVVAEVRDALSAVQASFQRANLLKEEVQVTRTVEDAERTRFELGDSTLFILNLREQQTAEAGIREVNAFADYFRAYALYELSIAAALEKPLDQLGRP